jgi:hypothetical protein
MLCFCCVHGLLCVHLLACLHCPLLSAATHVIAAVNCCNCSQELPKVHANDHQAAHLLQNAINSWAYGSPRSLIITLQHFTRVHEAVHGGSAESAASGGVDLSTLAGVMHVSGAIAAQNAARHQPPA